MDKIKYFLLEWKTIAFAILFTVIAGFVSINWLVDLVQSTVISGVTPIGSKGGVPLPAGNYEFSRKSSWILTIVIWLLSSGTVFAVTLYIRTHSTSGHLRSLASLQERYDELLRNSDVSSAAYAKVCQSVYYIAQQLYRDGPKSRHHLRSVHHECHIDSDATLSVIERVCIEPAGNNTLHFWKRICYVEDDCPKVSHLSDLNYEVQDCDGKADVVALPAMDEPRRKEPCLFFLPEIQAGETRQLEIRYRWPGSFKRLVEKKEVTYDIAFQNGTGRSTELTVVVKFHPEFGHVACEYRGSVVDGAQLTETKDAANATVWSFNAPAARLEGQTYRLFFSIAP